MAIPVWGRIGAILVVALLLAMSPFVIAPLNHYWGYYQDCRWNGDHGEKSFERANKIYEALHWLSDPTQILVTKLANSLLRCA